MGSVLLIAIFLFTYESNPEFELAPLTENTLELWDPQKLILNNGDAIFIATPDSTGQVKATISTIGL